MDNFSNSWIRRNISSLGTLCSCFKIIIHQRPRPIPNSDLDRMVCQKPECDRDCPTLDRDRQRMWERWKKRENVISGSIAGDRVRVWERNRARTREIESEETKEKMKGRLRENERGRAWTREKAGKNLGRESDREREEVRERDNAE